MQKKIKNSKKDIFQKNSSKLRKIAKRVPQKNISELMCREQKSYDNILNQFSIKSWIKTILVAFHSPKKFNS